MRNSRAARLLAAASALPLVALAADLAPGLYRIETRIHLPNVPEVAAPIVEQRCLSAAEIDSGSAFSVRSDNPIKACPMVDYQRTDSGARYRIVCPGPNAASAVALFEAEAHRYRGSIGMQMGGKNMTMTETQTATRVGECNVSPQ